MMSNSNLHDLVSSAPPAQAFQPERAEGVAVDELPIGTVLEVETGHTTYRVETQGEGKALISGHPMYCPEPVLVDLHGSVGGAAMLKIWVIEPGMKMEFKHPSFGTIRTSRVQSVRQLKVGAPS